MDIFLITTYHISSNFSRKNFFLYHRHVFSSSVPSFLYNETRTEFCIFFNDFFLAFSVQIEKWNKNGEYPGGIWVFTFPLFQMNGLFDKKQIGVWSENMLKGYLMS